MRPGFPDLQFVVDLARRYPEKPIYATFSAEKKHMEAAKAFLEPRGVPTFPMIEEPFEVLSVLTQCRRYMDRDAGKKGCDMKEIENLLKEAMGPKPPDPFGI